jgi:hypothetical protein
MRNAMNMMLLMVFIGVSEIDAASRNRQAGPAPGTLSNLDAKNGFRDLTFGQPPTPEMRLEEDAGDTKSYVRATDDLTIGGAQLHYIHYHFYKNRLEAVFIRTKGYVNSVAIVEVLHQAYGKGNQPNQFMEKYSWQGTRVFVGYDRKMISDETVAFWQSVPLYRERKADEKEQAKKGVSGL